MHRFNWNSIIDGIQLVMIVFTLAIFTVSIAILILFDVLAGTGVMLALTQQNKIVSVVISFATTGLLMVLMTVGYKLKASKDFVAVGWFVLLVSFGVYCLDTYFDALGADIMRYGDFVYTSDRIHNLYRALIGGISIVGEPMGIAVILGMDIVKDAIQNSLPARFRNQGNNQNQKPQNNTKHNQTHQSYNARSSFPSSLPRQNGKPKSHQSVPPPPIVPVDDLSDDFMNTIG
jgi:hypothetical protein